MNLSNFDLFSQNFNFSLKNQQTKKGTLFGSLLSIVIFGITICYFGYLLDQYFNNLIAPNYKAQNFVNDGSIKVDLQEDTVSFRFESNINLSLDVLEQQTNQTYFVYMAFYLYQYQYEYAYIPIDIIKCTNPDSQGYYCLEISKLQNHTLVSNQKENILSQIQINVYGCYDLDHFKQTIPDNCASQEKINGMINGFNAALKIRIKTSQYNTTSQKIETSYMSSLIYGLSNLQILTTVKILEQNTHVKQGFFIQSENYFSSPLQYNLESQTLDRQSVYQLVGLSQFIQLNILIDQVFQRIDIQYPLISQILSFVYSIFNLLMMIGFLAKKASLDAIKQDFLMLFLQNHYLDIYLQISKDIKLVKQSYQSPQTALSKQKQLKNDTDEESDSQQIQDEIDNQSFKFNKNIPSNSFKIKQTLDSRVSMIKKDMSQIENKQDRFFFEANNFMIDQKAFQQQKQNDKNESSFEQQDPFQNIKNLSNPKTQSQKSIINKKQKSQPIFEKSIELVPYLLSPTQPILRSPNHTLNTLQENKKNQQNIYNLNTNKLAIIKLDEQNIHKSNEFNQILQKFQVIKNKNISSKIKKYLFSFRYKKAKQITDHFSLKQFQDIQTQIDEQLDIFRIYKDILFLKKAIFFLLDQDQLAALQVVGCTSNLLNYKNGINLNHFEMQEAIQKSDELQQEYLHKFLYKCQQDKLNLNSIDKRILESINHQLII